MAEVLFYERPVPLNRNDHKDLRIKPIPNLKFASTVHSVPLTGVEFPAAARDIPILFGGLTAADAGPMALLGLRENENLFVDADGRWEQNMYIPAFVRRYPFILAEKPAGTEGDDFTVFLDEGYEGFGAEGDRLFKEDGTDSELLTNAVKFLGEFQQHVGRTQWFMEQLRKHNLLEPRNIRLEKDGKSINLNGLFVVSEEKLRQLDEKTTQEFLREGVLGWIYAHLLSLGNIDRVSMRLSQREQAEEATSALKN
ncbi:MAG TPA: SapC family protein [Dyella sp.]|uniref:SapC family protein n=1 Tax=Dyella sp. TaxID=1869338 RepID=UPI002D79B0BC|nr:SapC family protein [Dyella sp.]HET6552330.1 SapC family protein [Dyella sp.]